MKETPLRLDPRSAAWPEELNDIDATPDALWLRGRGELLVNERRVAIVGTRAPTPYGEAQAARFASVLAERGVCVVSGLARGIDQLAYALTDSESVLHLARARTALADGNPYQTLKALRQLLPIEEVLLARIPQ